MNETGDFGGEALPGCSAWGHREYRKLCSETLTWKGTPTERQCWLCGEYGTTTANIESTCTYNNEGKITSVAYPDTVNPSLVPKAKTRI